MCLEHLLLLCINVKFVSLRVKGIGLLIKEVSPSVNVVIHRCSFEGLNNDVYVIQSRSYMALLLKQAMTTWQLKADFYLTSLIEYVQRQVRLTSKRALRCLQLKKFAAKVMNLLNFTLKMRQDGASIRPQLSLVVVQTSILNTMSNFKTNGSLVAENRPSVATLSWPV